jgi:hypothetical protein
MSVQRDIDDEQAAVIDQRLGRGFAFLRDVLTGPGMLDEIPSGSTPVYRDVAKRHGEVKLIAFRAPDRAGWGVRVSTWPQGRSGHVHPQSGGSRISMRIVSTHQIHVL